MNVDESLRILRSTPRPEPDPMFGANVMRRIRTAQSAPQPTWGRRAMWIYWLIFIAFTATMLMPGGLVVPFAIAAAAIAVFRDALRPFAILLMGSVSRASR